jgi:uncharacterized protein (TIGR03437 family)
VTVLDQVNTKAGLNGRLNLAMSTSFQVASWDTGMWYQFPDLTVPLGNLAPHHSRLQVMEQAVPETAQGTWDFGMLNQTLLPVQSVGDHSPEFQLDGLPSYLVGSAGGSDYSVFAESSGVLSTAAADSFADYATHLLKYYNLGGFDAGTTHYQSPSPYPVTYWGILNEPDCNSEPASTGTKKMTAWLYADLYNRLVPQLKAVDFNMQSVALELCWAYQVGTPVNDWVSTFVALDTAPVDAVAIHFYGTGNQSNTDTWVFNNTLNSFLNYIPGIVKELKQNPLTASAPLFVTENNVNADYSNNGMSAINPGQAFVSDPRGTDAFFAAWRPWVFSQLGQGGAQGLWHWDFAADKQFGETDAQVSGSTLPTMLSYWVDYYLAHFFPAPPGAEILQSSTTDSNLEVLATRNDDGSIVVMVANRAVHGVFDNNGPGVPYTVNVNLSALGNFAYGTEVIIDSSTNTTTGPVVQSFTPGGSLSLNLNGYSVAFVRLSDAKAQVAASGVVNTASQLGGAVAPGEIVTITGTAIGPAGSSPAELESAHVIGSVVRGARAYFDGVAAPLLYAGRNELVAVVPYSVSGKTSTMLQLDYLGDLPAPLTLPVATAAPGLFAGASGAGTGVILNADHTANSSAHPAHAGDVVTLYLTGVGMTNSPYNGVIAGATPPTPLLPVTVTIGGQNASVVAVSGAPGLAAGMAEARVTVPAGLAPGAQSVVLTAGGVASQPGVAINVQ